MTPAEAFAALELPSTAGPHETQRAYRRLAFQYHPDRNPDCPDSFFKFKQITRAYRLLQAWFRMDSQSRGLGPCSRCGQYGFVRLGLDRKAYCRPCLIFSAGPPALPSPPVIIASCGFTILMLSVAVVCLATALSTRSLFYSSAALVSGGIGTIALAITAILISEVHRRRAAGGEWRWRTRRTRL